MIPAARRRVALVALIASAAGLGVGARPSPPHPSPQQPVLRTSVDQVVVDVVVTDASGAPVTGLTAADFDLRERGTAQTIGTFSEVSLPFTPRPDSAPLPMAGERGGTGAAESPADGQRVYVLILDDQHVALDLTADVRRLAHAFVRRFVQAGDRVGVVMTSGLDGGLRETTGDLSLVEAAIDRFAGMPVPMAGPSRGERNTDRIADAGAGSDTAAEATARAMGALRTLGSVAESLGAVRGRKAVLFVSEGFDADPGAWDTDERSALLRDILDAAARANVTIYPFSPRGLDHHSAVVASGSSPEALQRARPGADRRARARMLMQLAERTGGTASIDTNGPLSALERVAIENSHYYLLGYAPPDGKRDGAFRPIEVRARRPGLHVTARQGYYAPKDRKNRK